MSQAAKTSNYGFNINNINDAQHLNVDANFEKLDANLFGAAVPATSSSAGVKGAVAVDVNYIYVCTATNTWKRATLASF